MGIVSQIPSALKAKTDKTKISFHKRALNQMENLVDPFTKIMQV